MDGLDAGGGDADGTPDAAWSSVRGAVHRLGIPHEVLACDPEFADTAAFCARYGVAAGETANTILVASRAEPRKWCACIVLSTCRLDVNHAVARLLGVKRLSFASADETRERTGMMLGGVSVFGLPSDIAIYVDARVMEAPSIVVGGGSRSWKLRLAPEHLLRLPGAAVVADLANPRPESLPAILTP